MKTYIPKPTALVLATYLLSGCGGPELEDYTPQEGETLTCLCRGEGLPNLRGDTVQDCVDEAIGSNQTWIQPPKGRSGHWQAIGGEVVDGQPKHPGQIFKDLTIRFPRYRKDGPVLCVGRDYTTRKRER